MGTESEKIYFARADELVVQKLGDELLIYDRRTDVAHCLSDVAAEVWRSCESGASAEAMTRRLAEHRLAGVDGTVEAAALVEAALSELGEKNLLQYSVATAALVSRRHALRRMAEVGAAAVAVPLVVSAAVPKSAEAHGSPNTCRTVGQTCSPSNTGQALNNCCTTDNTNCTPAGVCSTCLLDGTTVTCPANFKTNTNVCCSGTCRTGVCATCTPSGVKPGGVNCGTGGQTNNACCSGVCASDGKNCA